jgi:hypothetical protein
MLYKLKLVIKKISFGGKKDSIRESHYTSLKEDTANYYDAETPVNEELNSNNNHKVNITSTKGIKR